MNLYLLSSVGCKEDTSVNFADDAVPQAETNECPEVPAVDLINVEQLVNNTKFIQNAS